MFIIPLKTLPYVGYNETMVKAEKGEMVTEYRYFQRGRVRISLLIRIEEC